MVSATIDHQPLEQVLKRLLRSLNYTILWEADKVVVIKVYGKADASTVQWNLLCRPSPRDSGGRVNAHRVR